MKRPLMGICADCRARPSGVIVLPTADIGVCDVHRAIFQQPDVDIRAICGICGGDGWAQCPDCVDGWASRDNLYGLSGPDRVFVLAGHFIPCPACGGKRQQICPQCRGGNYL